MPGVDYPLAYHITFGTYGTRLHGDDRGTVCRERNQPGDPIIGNNADWQRIERSKLRFDPVTMSRDQRVAVETAIPKICVRGGWTLQIAACQTDHVHVLLAASADGKAIRRWLKRWLGEALSEAWPLPEGASWWAEGGSVKWVWDDDYLHNVFEYIAEQRISATS